MPPFRTLAELMRDRKAAIRGIKSYEKPCAFCREGLETPEQHAEWVRMARERLADIEREIAERTSTAQQ